MDGELAIGHEGRIAWVYGTTERRDLDYHLAATLPPSDSPASEILSRLSQLAAHADLSSSDYARRHSMLPAFRVAAKHGKDLIHGCERGETFSRRLGMRTQKSGAFICLECVNADLQNANLSWYRRVHHIFGVDWCPTHLVPLAKIREKDPWFSMPHHWLESGEIETLDAFDFNLAEVEFLKRYADISSALLDRAIPLDVRALGYLIGNRARVLGLRTSINGQRSTISDHVMLKAPAKWLKTYFPHIAAKEKSGFVSKIDSAVISRTIPAQGAVYGLVLAAFFDTASEAIQYLETTVPNDVVENIKTPPRRGVGFWRGDFWDIYVSHRGLATNIAKSLGMDKTSLQEKLWSLGMPSLHNVGASKSWRALIRLHDGEGFRRSCELESAEEKEVEDLLRKVDPRVVALAKKLVGNSRLVVAAAATSSTEHHSKCGAEVQNDTPASTHEFDRFIDSVVGGKPSVRNPLENSEVA
jgi:hypothetical protein